MKISTKGIYALEITVDLALYADESNLVSLSSIAARRELSEKYLERIVAALKKEDLIMSVRGACGGYCLSRPPDQIMISEILAASEGDLAPVECLSTEIDCGIDCTKCPTRGMWNTMWEEIKSVVGNTTLADIVEKSKYV